MYLNFHLRKIHVQLTSAPWRENDRRRGEGWGLKRDVCLSVCDTGLDLGWWRRQGVPCQSWVGVGRVRNRATSGGRNPSQDRPPCNVYTCKCTVCLWFDEEKLWVLCLCASRRRQKLLTDMSIINKMGVCSQMNEEINKLCKETRKNNLH